MARVWESVYFKGLLGPDGIPEAAKAAGSESEEKQSLESTADDDEKKETPFTKAMRAFLSLVERAIDEAAKSKRPELTKLSKPQWNGIKGMLDGCIADMENVAYIGSQTGDKADKGKFSRMAETLKKAKNGQRLLIMNSGEAEMVSEPMAPLVLIVERDKNTKKYTIVVCSSSASDTAAFHPVNKGPEDDLSPGFGDTCRCASIT